MWDNSVEVRVAGTTRPVTKGGCDETISAELLDATVAAPGPRGVTFQVAERGIDGAVVRVRDHRSDVVLGESEDDGHGLRGAEGEVETGDTAAL